MVGPGAVICKLYRASVLMYRGVGSQITDTEPLSLMEAPCGRTSVGNKAHVNGLDNFIFVIFCPLTYRQVYNIQGG